ncbi:unnamed protein product [Jaminaea pallidilutea]
MTSRTRQSAAEPHFDSLHDLLQQAGYKETRVITPHTRTTKVAAANLNDAARSSRQKGGDRDNCNSSVTLQSASSKAQKERRQAMASTSMASVDTALNAKSAASHSLTDRVKGDVQERSPAEMQGSAGDITTGESTLECDETIWGDRGEAGGSPSSSTESTAAGLALMKSSPLHGTNDCGNDTNHDKQGAGQTIKHRSSTYRLWKGSLAYKKSLKELRDRKDASMKSQEEQSEGLSKVQWQNSTSSLRIAGNAASVGIGILSTDVASALVGIRKRPSLPCISPLQATSESVSSAVPETTASTEPHGPRWASTRSQDEVHSYQSSTDQDDVHSPPRTRRSTSKAMPQTFSRLLASAAQPVVSSDPAVAPRNADCFQGPDSRGLRHAKSVEALRSALHARKKRDPALSSRHSSAGLRSRFPDSEVPPLPDCYSGHAVRRSSSHDSLGSDLGNDMRTTYRAEDIALESNTSPTKESVGPPLLVLTSPTGCHAPQCIDLTGREYEARNFSPEGPLPRSLYDFVTSTVSPLSRRRSAESIRKSGALHSASGTQKCDEEGVGGNAKSGHDAPPKARPTRRGSRGGRKHASALKKAHENAPAQQLPSSNQSGTVKAPESYIPSAHKLEEDDPFMTHVSLCGGDRHMTSDTKERQNAVNRGIAAILDLNDENVPLGNSYSASRSIGKHTAPLSQTRMVRRTSSSELRGRIVDRTKPDPLKPRSSLKHNTHMSSPPTSRRQLLGHQRLENSDSPTRTHSTHRSQRSRPLSRPL